MKHCLLLIIVGGFILPVCTSAIPNPDSISVTTTPIPQLTRIPVIDLQGKRVTIPDYEQVFPFEANAPIYSPHFIWADYAPYKPDELVIGIVLDGLTKAYPVSVLQFREMVNDELAGDPILITWCPLCYSGLVHDRRIGDETFAFRNAGGLYVIAMTWFDHRTQSIWSEPLGLAIFGELKGG